MEDLTVPGDQHFAGLESNAKLQVGALKDRVEHVERPDLLVRERMAGAAMGRFEVLAEIPEMGLTACPIGHDRSLKESVGDAAIFPPERTRQCRQRTRHFAQ